MGKKRSHDEAIKNMPMSSKRQKQSPESSQSGGTPRTPIPNSGAQSTYRGHSISYEQVIQGTKGDTGLSQALNFPSPTPHLHAPRQSSISIKALPPYTGQPATLPPLPPILTESLSLVPFTHPGYITGSAPSKLHNTYDRLEILGDAYIEVIATRLIFALFPNHTAGRLSQQRELCVKNETLSHYSYAYGFDKRARLPSTVNKGDKKLWTKTMGDIFEAYVAAVIMSDPHTGFQTAEAWLTALWQNQLCPRQSKFAYETQTVDPNAKGDLAKKISSKGTRLDYLEEAPPTEIRSQGKIIYHIGVHFTGFGWQKQYLGSGSGLSKSDAGAMAATEALKNPLIDEIIPMKVEFAVKLAAEKMANGEGDGCGKTVSQFKREKKEALKEELDRIRTEKEEALREKLNMIRLEGEDALGKELAQIQTEKEGVLKAELDKIKSQRELDRELTKD